jgi:predicted amidohydrolase YtcJ
MENSVSLILVNARVLTLDPLTPRAEAVAIAGEQIVAVGDAAHVLALRGVRTELVDCRGLPLIPGLNDAHTHVLATAASLSGLDCSPPGMDSVGKLLAALRNKAATRPPGRWLRGYGLDPGALREGRYPTREELDAAAPDYPVRLEHSSGHAALLNSLGLAQAGINAETPDPPDGVIERDEKGEPTGLLLEMGSYLRQRLGRTRSTEQIRSEVAHLSETLLRYGITSVQDAGPDNGTAQWETFQRLTVGHIFQPRVTMMAGIGRLHEVTEAGLGSGGDDDRLRLGHAKVILTCTTGQLMPAPENLAELALAARELGFPIAVHAIEQEAVEAVIRVVELMNLTDDGAGESAPGPKVHLPAKNRIEHCSECPPQLMKALAHSGAMVVTQPGFIYWRGDGYLERVQPELLPHLYATGKMTKLQIPLAFGSDSPVVAPNPWPGIYAAITGKTRTGQQFPRSGVGKNSSTNGNDGMTLVEALTAHTLAGAKSEGMGSRKGMLRPGMLADLALLNRPLAELQGSEILNAGSRMTIVAGKVVWRDGEI